MSTIKDVSGTAFVVAEYRAEENREPTPIYDDPAVGLFLSDASRQAAERIASRFPAVKDMVKIRTRYFDDMLDAQIAGGINQVVILGAGLDTRAVRKQSAAVRYFEIDDPATMELKRRCYADARIDTGVTLISGNYLTDGLIDLLRANGFEFGVLTYLIWEGNVMYMPLANDKHTMLELKRHVKRFRLWRPARTYSPASLLMCRCFTPIGVATQGAACGVPAIRPAAGACGPHSRVRSWSRSDLEVI